MFERISNSWRLVKASYAVLQADKELIVFPIISFIGMIIVSAVFFLPMLAAGMLDSIDSREGLSIVSYIVLFLFYVVTYTVIIFANTALIGATMIRLRGGDPTLSDGIRIASERAGKIVGYALISATVGMVLRALSERAGVFGQIALGFIGMAWNLATFLVVPVLVAEDLGPIESIQRSTALLKRTWGEQIAGNFGIGTVFGLLTLAGVFLIGFPLVAIAASMDSPALIMLAFVLMIVFVMAVSLVGSTLSGIYQAALYRYAVDGEVGEYFDAELIQKAFKPKRG